MKEPFNLPHKAIASLTPYQVKYHYFRPEEQDLTSASGSLSPQLRSLLAQAQTLPESTKEELVATHQDNPNAPELGTYSGPSPKEIFWKVHREWGNKPEAEVERLWQQASTA